MSQQDAELVRLLLTIGAAAAACEGKLALASHLSAEVPLPEAVEGLRARGEPVCRVHRCDSCGACFVQGPDARHKDSCILMTSGPNTTSDLALFAAPPDTIPRSEHEALRRERDLLHDKLRQFEAYGIDNVAGVLDEREALRKEKGRLQVQLAGCLVAAEAGWSLAYQTVLDLRRRYDAVSTALCPECTAPMREHGCGGDYHAD